MLNVNKKEVTYQYYVTIRAELKNGEVLNQ